jgi:Uma2 family endonuclease
MLNTPINSPPLISTVPLETWLKADWESFLTFADDPALEEGKFYYDDGYMRIEMAPVGIAHSYDDSVISNLVMIFATLRFIPIKGLSNPSIRKEGIRGCQPDIAFYVGSNLLPAPHINSILSVDQMEMPNLTIEISVTSLEDDSTRKLQIYRRLGVKEYWVVDVNNSRVIATDLTSGEVIATSFLLPGLAIATVEEALRRSRTEDHGEVTRWLLNIFSGI